MVEEYRIVQSRFETEEEFDRLVELQNEVYKQRGLKFSKDRFKQWYIRNPVGNVFATNAYDGDKMIAHYACVPTQMLIDGKLYTGVKAMAVATHPNYQGKGLFRKLAGMTYDYAKQGGCKFVIGVGNASSSPCYEKYFPFVFVGKLNVEIVFGTNIVPESEKTFSFVWDERSVQWRSLCTKHKYTQLRNGIIGDFHPLINTYMGTFEKNILNKTNLPKGISLKPILYVGMGSKIKSLHFKIPKFVKHSPFNLIFMDLTDGTLPQITKDNILFQLFDFDVA